MGVAIRGDMRDPCGDGNPLSCPYQCQHFSFDTVLYSFQGGTTEGDGVKGIEDLYYFLKLHVNLQLR